MRIYIPGPPSLDQERIAHMLEMRHYRVVTSAKVSDPHYGLNRGMVPSAQQCRTYQAHEMLLSDAVVITDELDWNEVRQVVCACRYMGVVVVKYEALPAMAPSCGVAQHVLDSLDIANPLLQPQEQTLTVSQLRAWWDRVSHGFNTRFGWFFTNGNKVHEPVTYKLKTKTMTTA